MKIAVLCVFTVIVQAGATPAGIDIVKSLERDIQGKMTPFLAGRRGAHYLGGESVAGSIDCKKLPSEPAWKKKCYVPWPIKENETLGFTHPVWRDGRARGEGIVTDEITGTGHSLWVWDFYRNTRVLYGSVVVDGVRYAYPEPKTLLWRPDRLQIVYEVGGVVLNETKFITVEDSMLSIIQLVDLGSALQVDLNFDGRSYLNTKPIPTRDGDPANTPHHVDRNSVATSDVTLNAIHIEEKGTAYAKPGTCDQSSATAYPKNDPKNPCEARVGRLMYDGMHVYIMASVPLGEVKIHKDDDGAQQYNFTLCLSCQNDHKVVLGWAQGDDAASTASALSKMIKPKAAEAAADHRTDGIITFLSQQVPQFTSSDHMLNQAYYYGWANYWMYLLDVKGASGPWERYGHAQSAVNNFLGLHAHDSQYYIPLGAWVVDKETYAYGNTLMWGQAINFIRNGTSSSGKAYWAKRPHNLATPDNMGSTWVSSSPCPELYNHPEGAWRIYEKSGDRGFLEKVYDIYRGFFYFDGDGNQPNWGGSGPSLNGLTSIMKMALALNRSDDIPKWQAQLDVNIPRMMKSWQMAGRGAFDSHLGSLSSFRRLVYDGIPDEWADDAARYWLLNSDYGFMPPNDTWAAPLPVGSLNSTAAALGWVSDPWLGHTTKTWEVLDGLYRHHSGKAANTLTLGHIKAMQRQFGFTIFPEAWNAAGLAWGDQWYNWGGIIATLLPLEHIAGITYSLVERAPNATADGVLTICDYLPPSLDFVNVSVPIRMKNSQDVIWAQVSIRIKGHTKYVDVVNNPLGALRVQPWLGGHVLQGAAPKAFTKEVPRGHVGWEFVGKTAASQSVKVWWKTPASELFV